MGNPQYGPPQGGYPQGPQQGYGPPQGQGYGPPQQYGPQPGQPVQGYQQGPPPQQYQQGPPQQAYGGVAEPDWERWYNEADTSGGGDYAPGWWPAVVEANEYGYTKNGDKRAFIVTVKFTAGPNAGRSMKSTQAISEYTRDNQANTGGMGALFRRLHAVGIPVGERHGDPAGSQPWFRVMPGEQAAAQSVGNALEVEVIHDAAYGNYKIQGMRRLSAGVAAGQPGPYQAPAPQQAPPGGPQAPAPYGYQPGAQQAMQAAQAGAPMAPGQPGNAQYTPQGMAQPPPQQYQQQAPQQQQAPYNGQPQQAPQAPGPQPQQGGANAVQPPWVT